MKEYLYCITERSASSSLSLKGILGLPVQQKEFRNFHAFYSPLTEVQLNKLLRQPNAESADFSHPALAHGKTVEKIHSVQSAVPFQFMTVFKSDKMLESFLERHYGKLERQLQLVNDCAEFGLRAAFKDDALPKKVGQTEQPASGTAFMQQKMQAYLAESKKSAYAERWAEKLKERFNGLFENFHQTVHTKNQLQLEINFLVKRSNFELFKKQYQEFSALPSPVSFMLSGPWAPYHFVEIPATVK